jgi:HD-GYP domain-containing protein (c-di-GMP phosphodiesterase class II)
MDINRAASQIIDIGIALNAERDLDRLMEKILFEAIDLCSADGGTFYRTEGDQLNFEILRTKSLDIHQGGSSGEPVSLPPIQLFTEEGHPRTENIVTFAANTKQTVKVDDVYGSDEFDFTGTKRFDQGMGLKGFKSQSFLTVPLQNHKGAVIGVLQLLNHIDEATGSVSAFPEEVTPLLEALAGLAGVLLDNAILVDELQAINQAFIRLIASALDAKSPYTGGHCVRVPAIAEMLTEAAHHVQTGPFANFTLSDNDREELFVASWLHDCGKITTPEYVVDKATKLETITDRIHEIRTRFEVAKREAEIRCLRDILAGGDPDELNEALEQELAQIDDDFAFIAQTNQGGEFMDAAAKERLAQIAERKVTRTLSNREGLSFAEQKRMARTEAPDLPALEAILEDRPDHLVDWDFKPYSLDPDNPYGFKMSAPEYKFNLGELYNLSIDRGTLTEEERFIINDHIVQTTVMLETLPWPRHLARVPEIACGHHEKMDGTGYPRKLSGEGMSAQAKVMAIADVFEALTAADRPYKPRKTLSESVKIMGFMVKDQHLDRDLFELFLDSGVYRQYGMDHLLPDQIDDVDLDAIRALYQ